MNSSSQWCSPSAWARQEFGSASLGDARRTRRLIEMAATAAKAPAGRVSEVFTTARAAQAAYDFLEHDTVEASSMLDAAARSTLGRSKESFVVVPIDGSSLTLVDNRRAKDFGVIGPGQQKAAGLKVITALGVASDGTPLGIVAQRWWARANNVNVGRRPNHCRPTAQKETQRWLDVIDDVRRRCQGTQTKAWIQIDREGDARPLLLELARTGQLFTVRSAWNRRLWTTSGDRLYLADEMRRCAVVAAYDVDIPANPHRSARRARLHVRAMTVELRLEDKWQKTVTKLRVHAVEVLEIGTTPRGEKPLHWRLLTNYPLTVDSDVLDVIRSYTQRWRIEDFHRTWKRGGCDVEATQLRSQQAVIKWATLLAVVATRLERLKHLARTAPDSPADVELSSIEIRALLILKRRQAKQTEKIPDDGVPSMADAVRWLADLGGYTGKSSGGPPGAITIGRGLEKVRTAAEVLDELGGNAGE